MVWPAIIAAAGQLGASALSSRRPRDTSANTVGINASPLFQQMALMSGVGLGQPVNRAMLMQGSPLSTLLSAANSIGLRRRGQVSFGRALDDFYSMIQQGSSQGLSAAEIARMFESSPLLARRGGNGRSTPLMSRGSDNLRSSIAGGGPIGLLINERNTGVDLLDPLGLFNKKKKWGKELGGDVLRRLAAQSGYGSLEELIQAQMDFEQEAGERQVRYDETSENVERGRLGALNSIANIQSDFVAPTREEILAQAQTAEDVYRGAIARERADSERALLEQANQMRINPGARLGRLDEWQAQANLDAQPQGLARALQLLSGQQGLQSNALASLQGSLAAPEASAQNLLALQSQNQIGMGQIAAQQAMQLAGMNAQANANMAGGIAGAGNALAQMMFMQQNPELFGGSRGFRLDGGQAAAPWGGGQAAAPGEPTPFDMFRAAGIPRDGNY